MIDRQTLETAFVEYERQEDQALADANAARGAALAIRQLLLLLEQVESQKAAGEGALGEG